MTNLKTNTLKLLKKRSIRLNKRKGQNYLVDSQILSKIMDHAEVSCKDTILEIGSGIGTLTIPLAKRAEKVVAVEQDKEIAKILKERLKSLAISNVEIIIGDVVKEKLPPFNKVVSNLPYQISSPITFKLLKEKFDFAILMYQLEFAERMLANPGDNNYSRLSVMLHFCAEMQFLFEVSSESFFPQPQVSSAVVKLIPLPENSKAKVDTSFSNTSRALFQHKRKKVRNALLDSFHEISDIDKNSVRAVISKLETRLIDERVFKLKPEEIMAISDRLKELLAMNNINYENK